MEWDLSHAAVAAFAFVVGVGVALLAKDSPAPTPRKSNNRDTRHIRVSVPRRVAIDVLIAERRELLNSALGLTKTLATFAVAGMAAGGTLFTTARAAHIVVLPAFMLFFLAFIVCIFPHLETARSSLGQFGTAFQTVLRSRHENVKLPIVFPGGKTGLYPGGRLCLTLLGCGVGLLAISLAIPVICSISPHGTLSTFGEFGEKICYVVRMQGK